MRSIEVALSETMNFSKIQNFIKIDFTGNNGLHGSKVPLILENNMDYFVEDRRKNVLEISQEGVVVFMPRKSWNTLPENTPNVIQYDNCDEILEYINTHTK